jgi:hypothetical protein
LRLGECRGGLVECRYRESQFALGGVRGGVVQAPVNPNPTQRVPISKQPEQPSHTLSRAAAIILGVARHHTFLRTAQEPPAAAPFAATIARVGHRSPRHPHSHDQRDNQRPASLPGTLNASQTTSLLKYTVLARRAVSRFAITRYDDSTTRSSTTTCEHHRCAPRSWERRRRARTFHTL